MDEWDFVNLSKFQIWTFSPNKLIWLLSAYSLALSQIVFQCISSIFARDMLPMSCRFSRAIDNFEYLAYSIDVGFLLNAKSKPPNNNFLAFWLMTVVNFKSDSTSWDSGLHSCGGIIWNQYWFELEKCGKMIAWHRGEWRKSEKEVLTFAKSNFFASKLFT